LNTVYNKSTIICLLSTICIFREKNSKQKVKIVLILIEFMNWIILINVLI